MDSSPTINRDNVTVRGQVKSSGLRLQSDLVNAKESLLSVCVKPYHTNNRNVQKREEIKVLHIYFTRSMTRC